MTNAKQRIMERLSAHFEDAKKMYPEAQILGIFLQGSQNYGVDLPTSDVDSRLIILPSMDEIIFGKQPASYTHIRDNDEHIDVKEVRQFFNILLKQNMNFLEILFTEYFIVNPIYETYWNELLAMREEIAHYDTCKAVNTMCGQARAKYSDMYKISPARGAAIEKYGYDPKSFHHLVRIHEFLSKYTCEAAYSYEACLKVSYPDFHRGIKQGSFSNAHAVKYAEAMICDVRKIHDDWVKNHTPKANKQVAEKLTQLQKKLMVDYLKTILSTE